MATNTETYENPSNEEHAHETDTTISDDRYVPPARVSWGAIFAGTAIALAVSFMLGLLGMAIGLQPTTGGGEGIGTMDAGAGIWLIGQFIVSLFAGGWVAGRLSGKPRGIDGVLNGGVVWAITVLLGVFGFTTLATTLMDVSAPNEALWWTLLAIVLGLITACIGGWIGSPKIEHWRERREHHHRREGGYGRRRTTSPPTPA